MKRTYLPQRRKREGKTDYKKRKLLLLAEKPRLIVRKSGKHMICQIANYESQGDRIMAATTSQMLSPLGWKYNTGNIPSAYLTGLLLGKKAKEKKMNNLILDKGRYTNKKGGRIYAAVKGVIDMGIHVEIGEETLETEKRMHGNHIAEYAKKIDKKKMFFKNMKEGADPEEITKQVQQMIQKIKGSP